MTEVVQISAAEARALTDRIKAGAEALWHLVMQAYETGAWQQLGYTSWDDYCTREFGTSRIRLPREERQEVVASMREIGMSTRAIASATGASIGTIHGDSRCSELNTSEPRPVTGLDGKTYTPRPAPEPEPEPEPAPEYPDGQPVGFAPGDLDALNTKPEPTTDYLHTPKAKTRRPLEKTASTLIGNVRRAAAELDTITSDNRFTKNRQAIAARNVQWLTEARDDINTLINALTESN